MRIPWPTDGGPILFQHGFEYLQARHDDQLLELGLRINEDIDQRQVPWRRGYRLATARDCARRKCCNFESGDGSRFGIEVSCRHLEQVLMN